MKLAIILSFNLFALPALASVFIGKATQDCQCHTTIFEEEPIARTVKKHSFIGEVCSENVQKKDIISCTNGDFGSIHCPKVCVQLIVQKTLTKEDYIAEVKKLESSTRATYASILPKNIYQELQKKYPNWYPVLVNLADNPVYIAKFGLDQDFYFQAAINSTEVSIIYFYKGMNELLSNSVSWSFWNTSTGELIYENLAPYKSMESSYVNRPCLVPFGKDFKQLVLYGIVAGPGDAAGCCGPYSLQDLKKSGPVLLPKLQGTEVLDTVTYHLCGKSTDPKTGKYNETLSLDHIDGPANLRASHALTSPIIGSCPDQALVADLGSNDKWNHVYCNGKLGWTFNTNIRAKNKNL